MPYKDKEKQKEYQRLWLVQRRQAWFANKSCVTCNSIENLELDHIDESAKVTHRVWCWSQKRRDEELAKCQVLCLKCHKAKTRLYLAKLKAEDILFIRNSNLSHSILAKKYDTSVFYIRKIKYYVKWKDIN